MRPSALAGLAAVCLVLARPAAAQEPSSFVTTLGNDTVAVERYVRLPGRIEGRQVVRTPRTTIRDYVAYQRPDGSMSRFEISWHRPGAPPHARAAVDLWGDTASVQLNAEGKVETWRVPAGSGSVPYVGSSVGTYEPALAYARGRRGGRLDAAQIPIGGAQPLPLRIRPLGRDSVLITSLTGENRVEAGREGGITGWNGLPSNFKITARRVASVDLDRLAASFAARDQQGQAMGTLSPTDSVRATVGGASLSVRYGRPAKRGRQIFGTMIPWGQVWRTGANQATHLTTDRDLRIGGTPVPAGTYTLFSIPSPEGWTLIVNRQTGQSGTEYDHKQDLARIPMTRDHLAQPVEQFTIALEPDGTGGRLVLMWDDTRVWVPVEVR